MGVSNRHLLAAVVSLLSAGPLSAAGLKVDIVIDGKPAGEAGILLDGTEVGRSNADGSFWYQGFDGGRHTLTLKTDGQTIPYHFSVADDEAALISISKKSGDGAIDAAIDRVPLAAVQVQGQDIKVRGDDAALMGVVAGGVYGMETGGPVRNATVKVASKNITVRSDRNGEFKIELPKGEYSLLVEHPEYMSRTFKEVNVMSNMEVNILAELPMKTTDGGNTIEEVVAVASYQPYNPIDQERMASAVLDTMDFTQIARFDDSTVSSALKRVVGVSMEDSRYAIVRGMKSRYQSTFFNGAVLPATDPARRDLPLDIFPADIMQSLSLQKSATADVPGSATAGHIEMTTKPTPDEGFFKISASVGYGDANSNEGVMSKESGSYDWTGFDDGFRAMPDIVEESHGAYFFGTDETDSEEFLAYREELGESLESYGVYWADLPPDMSVSFSGGDSWLTEGGQRFGVIGALRYSNKWTNDEKLQNNFVTSTSGDAVYILLNSSTVTYDTNNIIDLSGMLNLDWRISDNHTLGLNNLMLRHTTSSAEYSYKREIPASPVYVDVELPEDPRDWPYGTSGDTIQTQKIDWIEEQLVNHQLWGEHFIALSEAGGVFGNLKADWQLSRSRSEYDRPNAQSYAWAGSADTDAALQVGSTGAYHIWEYSEEDGNASSLDLELPVNESGDIAVTFKTGIYRFDRKRDGYEDRYFYLWRSAGTGTPDYFYYTDPADIFTEDNIGDGSADSADLLYVNYGGSSAEEDDTGIDNGYQYRVEQRNNAYYLQTDWNLWQTVTANVGVRKESFKVEADQYNYTPEPLYELLDETRTLPSVGLTWLISDQWQFRSAYSKTVSWPETFELLPRYYRDIETLTTYIGNPDLKPADIKNYDMRLEWYPSETESFSLAAYYKDMANPIENAFDSVGNDYDYYTFTNVRSGKVRGWELDFRKEFVLGAGYGHEFFVQGNYTDIHSEVELDDDSAEYDLNRPLQGQPDYIANIQLGYDHLDSGQELTLVFNRKGKELVIVTPAVGSNVTNVYSEPYDDLKLIYTKRFGDDLKLSLSGENILDSEKRQYYEKYDKAYLSYKPGVKYKLKVSYQF